MNLKTTVSAFPFAVWDTMSLSLVNLKNLSLCQPGVRRWNLSHRGNQINWWYQLVSPWGQGSTTGREKAEVGMGQCLRYQMRWEDLEEYQVGRGRFWPEVGASQGRWEKGELSRETLEFTGRSRGRSRLC